MARFRGTLRGTRSIISRLGHVSSGLTVEAQSWQGKVVVSLYADGDVDKVCIRFAIHNGAGDSIELYDGPVDGSGVEALVFPKVS